MALNCKQIIKGFLLTHGYDGLYCPCLECGCFLDDLAPCCEDISECLPGVKVRMQGEFEGKIGIGPLDCPERIE